MEGLEESVEGVGGKVWLIDGRFPIRSGIPIEFNAGKAVDTIRRFHQDAKITLYSSDKDGEEHARNLGIEYFNKGPISPVELVETLKESLG